MCPPPVTARVTGGNSRDTTMGMNDRQDWTVPVIGFLLWVPAMTGAAHEWANGSYYDYGWVVPPLALWLWLRRWGDGAAGPPLRTPSTRVLWVAAAGLLPWFTLLRVLSHADPAWRLPVALAGGTAAVAGHLLLAGYVGWKRSAGFWRITLFSASALPLPTVVESRVVQTLTDAVLAVVARLFAMAGEPVVVSGELLMRNGVVVEVSEDCSGIRSFLWFVMGTWLFAELYRLAWRQVLALLAWAAGMAFVINVVRAWTLAQARFTFGEEAFQTAHDWAGLVAFVISALLFRKFSILLSSAGGGKLGQR